MNNDLHIILAKMEKALFPLFSITTAQWFIHPSLQQVLDTHRCTHRAGPALFIPKWTTHNH